MKLRSIKAPKSPEDELAELEARLSLHSPVGRWHKQKDRSGDDLVQALAECERSDWISHAVAYHHLRHATLSPTSRKMATQILAQTLEQPAQYGAEPATIRRALMIVFVLVSAWVFYPAIHRALTPHYNHGLLRYTASGFFDGPPFYESGELPQSGDQAFDLASLLFGCGLLTLFTYPFLFVATTAFDPTRMHRLQHAAVETLECIGDAACIAALTLHVRQQSARYDAALQTLKKILPTITAEDYGQLPSETTAALVYLAESFDPELALLALDSLEQVGDSSSVLTVERLAAQTVSKTVQSRAAAVLPTLYARRARENAAATLLRAGAQPASSDLVRPVYGSHPDVNNLLRASDAAASGD